MPFLRVETERLLLRDHTWLDLPTHHALLSDPVSMRYMTGIQTQTLSQSHDNLQYSISEIENPNRSAYFLRVETKTGVHIGEIGLTLLQTTPLGSRAQLGYFLRKSEWGRGYATEAARAMLHLAFLSLGVFRLESGCLAENIASEHVLQKLGLHLEANRPAFQWHEGMFRDRHEYYLLREEYLRSQ